jgi:periplasmic divalent cation tolerance protein
MDRILGALEMQDCKQFDVLSVTTTLGSPEAAQSLAREILDRKLAACVQLEPGITSLYRWKGAMCEEAEVRLVIKTLPACETALRALFTQKHPYELPQFLAVRMQASEAYGEWVRGEVVIAQSGQSPPEAPHQ